MQSLVADVLAAWREAERLAETLPPGSPERQAANAAAARLRILHGDALSAASRGVTDSTSLRGELDAIRLDGLDGGTPAES